MFTPNNLLNTVTNTSNYQQDPKVWGPKFWFSLHVGSLAYPVSPSPTYVTRMKWFIMGLPVMLACDTCKDHATAYIMSRNHEMDKITSCRDEVFKFFVDFHNAVNERLGKPFMSYETARTLYSVESS